MIPIGNTPPHESRGFLHKRIARGVRSFVTSGLNPISGASAFLAPVQTRGQKARSGGCPPGFIMGSNGCKPGCPPGFIMGSNGCKPAPAAVGLAASSRCIPPFFPDGRGGCELDLIPGPGGGGTGAMRDVGESTMGRFGAALVPGNRVINRAVCLRGMVLANDGLCYNRSQVPNKDRMWPKGRAPLLTGGQMRAISIAASAGKKLERTTKRLQKIGLMKKPSPRRITSGPTEHHHHS